MTFYFSNHSLEQEKTLHPELKKLVRFVIQFHDFKIQEGHRTKESQNAAVANGFSKTPWPESKHNRQPSEAVDLFPFLDGVFIDFPENKKDKASQISCKLQWVYFAGLVIGIAFALRMFGEMKAKVRWGGDFNGNFNVSDDKFKDWPHFELVL